ncbi:hypothetical protein NKI88_16120 [Mesorhizobium sp. M0317]|uniref:hypothetical protein n=1 Tax=Mesorhizobium sp. M0317 TaxID=2956935 RepID=UPI00333B9700
MYVLKGKRRVALRWLLVVGLLTVALVAALNYVHAISARNSYALLSIYFTASILSVLYFLHESEEKSALSSLGLTSSPTRFTLVFYLVYASIILYPFVEKRFQPEFIGHFSFLVIFLAAMSPDVLLFLRTKLGSGNAIYQRANSVGVLILVIFIVVSVGVGVVASQ